MAFEPRPCWQLIDFVLRVIKSWPDAFALKELNQLRVYCLNSDLACTWTGPKIGLKVAGLIARDWV